MRLHTRITLLIVALTIATGGTLTLLVNYRVHNALEQELEKRGVVVAQTLAEHVAHNVINGDVVAAHEALQEIVRRTEDVEFAYIHGFEGEIFAHSFEDGFPRALLSHNREHDLPYTEAPYLERYATEKGLGLLVKYPLIDGMEAHLHIGLNETALRDQVKRTRDQIVGITSGVALAAALIGIFLSRSIARPLEQLSESLRAFGERRIERELDYRGGGREVADVTHAFNWMIAERAQAEEALKNNQEQLELITDKIPALLAYVDADQRYLYVNQACADWYEFSKQELIGKHVQDVLPEESYRGAIKQIEAVLQGEEISYENVDYNAEGKLREVQATYVPHFGERGQVKAFLAIVEDITKRKRAEEQIRAALREKEMLLREVHHRVKNNLQVISSLLDMSGKRTTQPEVIDLLAESRARVHTMALIHSQLYQSERFDRIDLAHHIRQLIGFMEQVYAPQSSAITTRIESPGVTLPITQAIPCALALNEVLSNAYRHAFPEGQSGTIQISIQRPDDDTIVISVKDDGVGIPEEVDVDTADSLGLKLIKGLIQGQLHGKLRIERDQGTKVIMEFKVSSET